MTRAEFFNYNSNNHCCENSNNNTCEKNPCCKECCIPGPRGPRGLTGPQGPQGETQPVSAHLVITQIA